MASDSASRGPSIIITGVLFTVFATLAVVARLISRLGLLKNGGRDEIAIVIALVCSQSPRVYLLAKMEDGSLTNTVI